MTLRFKTVIGVALIEALVLALLIGTVVSFQHDSAEQALLKRANTTATLFASTTKDPVLSLDLASLEAFSLELLENPDLVYVRVLDQSEQEYAAVGDSAALSRQFREGQSLDDVIDGVFDVSADIVEGDIHYGRVEIGFNIDTIREVIADTRELSITIAVVELALVALFSYMLGTYLTRQLKVLRECARNITRGDYTTRIETTGKDEISDVSNAFNHMSSALLETQVSRDTYEKQLVELNQTLEQRVERRTAQLQRQMEALEEANRKLAETQAKLVQSETLASVGQMAAGIAHEINNPIGFVRSNLTSLEDYVETYQSLLGEYARLKQTGTDLQDQINTIEKMENALDIAFINEDIRALLSESIDGTTRVRDIVQGLNNFFPDETNSHAPCNLNDCIDSALKTYRERTESPKKIRTELGTLPEIEGEADKLTHVFVQMLLNADAAVTAEGEITIRSEHRDDRVEVQICDNGTGILPEHIDRIFDPFFTTREVGQGTGLGLAVCYGTVQNHRGEISVTSDPGQGSSFRLSFPVAAALGVAA
jgi:C4-dicarboxylate-specific signal transduction histidine kinase